MSDNFRARAKLVPKGNRYEDFEPGRVFKHHWGRTITESETTLFSTLTLHFNPHYYNAAYARAHGHPGIVTWHTTGLNQREEKVIDFKRTNLVRQRTAA